jgi:hypothetical protein
VDNPTVKAHDDQPLNIHRDPLVCVTFFHGEKASPLSGFFNEIICGEEIL